MNFTLNCKGRLLHIRKPIVMGIVNCTPDSFYDGGQMTHINDIVILARQMIDEGATILDIGGMSSRPGASEVSEGEEADRVLPVVDCLRHEFPDVFLSIDTYRSNIARQALAYGADIINDISSAQFDPEIAVVAATYKAPYIAMHMQGVPATMQLNPQYENVCEEVFDFFTKKIEQLQKNNVVDIMVDPGFGFGKTLEQNFQLLKHLSMFRHLQKPVLTGISRKSMVCKPLQIRPAEALNGTTALHMPALQNGAAILRVHDVREAAECIQLYEIYRLTADS